ncbi:hypothetical protein PP747_gp006 [Rhizobium phage RHph_Y38]|uniref:Uncharacterized protein n=2 Tax=Acanvirus TaxID=3044653 RepID=A0A7S5QX27_9CAUD|nr:hypothetical protein PP747_gp006 [Rhizobium phage RHph_Y38]YP_010658218.1 hypothetical protein PP749_gp007 [Rhizobium phage RHEph22]QIG67707.1 hypothetical protein EVB52_006 [Rhizobium phage RHph_Y38]QXV74680.1 hypothetical protein [Rhizobium phage RHEph22]
MRLNIQVGNWDIYQMTNGRIVIHNWYDIYHDHDYYQETLGL